MFLKAWSSHGSISPLSQKPLQAVQIKNLFTAFAYVHILSACGVTHFQNCHKFSGQFARRNKEFATLGSFILCLLWWKLLQSVATQTDTTREHKEGKNSWYVNFFLFYIKEKHNNKYLVASILLEICSHTGMQRKGLFRILCRSCSNEYRLLLVCRQFSMCMDPNEYS